MEPLNLVAIVVLTGMVFYKLLDLWMNVLPWKPRLSPSLGHACVACGSKRVTALAPRAYRCSRCGHEGGEGWAAWARARREAELRSWDPQRRLRAAEQALVEAHRLVVTGIAELESAAMLLAYGRPGHEMSERDRARTAGVGLLLQARERARDAQVLLGWFLGAAAVVTLENDTPSILLDEAHAMRQALEIGLGAFYQQIGARPAEPAPVLSVPTA